MAGSEIPIGWLGWSHSFSWLQPALECLAKKDRYLQFVSFGKLLIRVMETRRTAQE